MVAEIPWPDVSNLFFRKIVLFILEMGFIADCSSNPCESCTKPATKPRTIPRPGPRIRRQPRVFKFHELARATNNFSETNLVGKGSHACVYRAVLGDGQVVAVKRPTIARRSLDDSTSFDNELEVLSEINHRHLVNLIGFCDDPSEKLLVVEYMVNGTLFDLLHSGGEPLNWHLRVQMAFQAAKALLALHSASPPIIHRDVKSSNILVDANWNAKLGDLGLALRDHRDGLTGIRTPPAGTMGYIDPQYETPAQLSTSSDVFSFGILLLEIISGRKAIDVRFNPSSIVDWATPLIKQGKSLELCDPTIKPPSNVEIVRQLVAIAARSVRLSRDRRPQLVNVVEGLRRISVKVPVPRFSGKLSRKSTTSRSISTSEDYSDEDSFCRLSGTLSILDEGSILGDSPRVSVEVGVRQMSAKVVDYDIDGMQLSSRTSPATEAMPARRSARHLVDDVESSEYLKPVRSDLTRNRHVFPMASGNTSNRFANNDTDKLRRRSAESPVFGSKEASKSMERRLSVSSVLSPQNSFSRFRVSEKADFGYYRLPTDESSEFSNEQVPAGSANPMSGNGTALRAFSDLRTGVEDLNGYAWLNDELNVQSAILFTREFSPTWNINASAKTLYSNFDSGLKKVDQRLVV